MLYAVLSFDENTYVHGDAARISQVITNLLSYAVKFTPKGYISVQVTLKHQGDVPILLASIEDTGVGMSDEILSRIFRPFQNDTASASEELNGNGLGLSIVNQLVGILRRRRQCIPSNGSRRPTPQHANTLYARS